MKMGLHQVTHDEFFAALKADRRDIMPSSMGPTPEGRYPSEWRTNDAHRVLFGKSDSNGNGDHRYWLWQHERDTTAFTEAEDDAYDYSFG